MYSRAYVEITNICNMNCSFCHGHSRPARRMNEAEFTHILDQLSGKTQYLYYHLMGEPLLHPLLPQFLRIAKARGFRSVITTNGTLLKDCGEALLKAGVHKVSISLHSFEQADDDKHLNYLQETADFAEKASGAGIIVVFRLWNRGWDDGRNEKTETFLRKRFAGEWAENTRGCRIRKKLFLEWGDRFLWPDAEASAHDGELYCYGLSDHFGILCDGTVVPCCMDCEGIIALGNIFETNLSEILSSPRAEALRKGFENRTAAEDLCRRCGYAQRFI